MSFMSTSCQLPGKGPWVIASSSLSASDVSEERAAAILKKMSVSSM